MSEAAADTIQAISAGPETRADPLSGELPDQAWPPVGERRVFWTTFAIFTATIVAAQLVLAVAAHGMNALSASFFAGLLATPATWFVIRLVVRNVRLQGLSKMIWLLAGVSVIGGALVGAFWVGAIVVDSEGLQPILRALFDTNSTTVQRVGVWQLQQDMLQALRWIFYQTASLNLAFGVVYFLFVEQLASRDRSVNLERYEAAATLAQLKMLRFQLNPHFLFNSLSAITTLVGEKRNEDAEAMLLSLSRFLRFSLENDVVHKVTLSNELEALRLYISIEQARFGERLRTELDVESGLSTAYVPGLLLQPLIENAVKHGISRWLRGGVVALHARSDSDVLHLEVRNSPFEPRPQADIVEPSEDGVGLRNTRERLRVMYGGRASLQTMPTTDGGFCATIRLPLEKAENAVDDGEH